ncbi:unnamed protein product [Gordionus sp. m RMFG-2023]
MFHVITENISDWERNANFCIKPIKKWDFLTFLRIVAMPILLFIGIFGNSLTIYLISKIRNKSLNYYYLKWIAYLNIITILFYWTSAIVYIKTYVSSPYFNNKFFVHFNSKYTLIFINGFYAASVFCLCLLLLDRYVSIKHPNLFTRFEDSKLMKYSPYFILILCNIICFSSYFWYDTKACYLNSKYMTSYELPDFKKQSIKYYKISVAEPGWASTYDLIREIILSITPGVFILYFGVYITYELRSFFIRKTQLMNENKALDANIALAHKEWKSHFLRNISAFLYFILYCLCNIPNILVIIFRANIRNALKRSNPSWLAKNITEIANILEAVFFTLSFLIYIIFDNNFKHVIRKIVQRAIGKIYPEFQGTETATRYTISQTNVATL